MQALSRRDNQAALAVARELVRLFGPERAWIELQHHLRPGDRRRVATGVELAEALGIGYVATNNVHYAHRAEHRLQDVMVAIRHNLTMEEAAPYLRPNSEYYLKSAAEMVTLFAPYPVALENTWRVAEQCSFALPTGLQALPQVPTPEGLDANAYLELLCQRAAQRRYAASPPPCVMQQVAHELGVISRAGLANYFLVVWDVVRFARQQGIRCQGRGSACNSLVAYLLGISPIDPLAHDLLFERFLSDERRGVPDIDLDLQTDRREEVIQYLYQRYGPAHVAMACTISTFRARSALRDAAKALGIPAALVEPVVGLLDGRGAEALPTSPELNELAERGAGWHQLREVAHALAGSPRHLGLHNGGMVVAREALATRIPIEPAAMAERTVVQWDKDALEEAGVIKLDLLGLRMLSVLAEAQAWVAQETGRPVELEALPLDDPAIYDLLCRADTIGLFQVESRAQDQVLPRLRPRCFGPVQK